MDCKKGCFERLGTRFQDKKYEWEPVFLRDTALSYMIGKIQYGSSLHWIRATKENIDHVRFLYCKVLAACMGLETSELVSLRLCKKQQVSENHKNYRRACEFMNMPTLKDLAVKNARNLIRQWGIYDPSRFTWSEDGNELTGVADQCDPKLLNEAFELSCEDINDWYPAHSHAKADPLRLGGLDKNLFPEFSQTWDAAVLKVGKIFCQFGAKPSTQDFVNCYVLMCRELFKVNEPYHRSSKRLEPSGRVSLFRKRPRPSENDEARPAKKSKRGNAPPLLTSRFPVTVRAPLPVVTTPVRTFVSRNWDGGKLSCVVKAPLRRGRRIFTCRICGYAVPCIKDKNVVKFSCCGKICHKECWIKATADPVNDVKKCESVIRLLNKDLSDYQLPSKAVLAPTSVQVNYFPGAQSQAPSTGECITPCMYCQDDVSIIDKYHLRKDCKKINAVLSRTGLLSNRVYDPGGKESKFGSFLSPVAERSAAMTAISRITGTPGCAKDV